MGAPDAGQRLSTMLRRLQAGVISRLAFAVPPGVTWTLPIYELALMTAHFARQNVVPAELSIATAEGQPLEIFGPEASEMVRGILGDSSIRLQTHGVVAPRGGEQWRLELADASATDEIVAMPQLRGPGVGGLPADDDGFLIVDEHGRVFGQDDVYSAGDAISFPIKQGGLAAQQADTAAAHIANRAGIDVDPAPFEPVLHAKLLTGAAPRYLRRALRAPAPAELSAEPPWRPEVKIVGRHLAPYLASHGAWGGDTD